MAHASTLQAALLEHRLLMAHAKLQHFQHFVHLEQYMLMVHVSFKQLAQVVQA
jgi:hypothetical protein